MNQNEQSPPTSPQAPPQPLPPALPPAFPPAFPPVTKPVTWAWRRYVFGAIGIVLAFAVFLAVINRPRPLVISPETTLLTEPLTPDGKRVDYFAWLEAQYPPEMKTDDNAARILTRLIGPGSDCTPTEKTSEQEKAVMNELADRYYEKLGLDRAANPPMYVYTEFEQAARVWLTNEMVEKSGAADEKAIQDQVRNLTSLPRMEMVREYEPLVVNWAAHNDEALDAVVEASRASVCRTPIVYSGAKPPPIYAMKFPGNTMFRESVRGLLIRAALRIHNGEIDSALADMLAARRLGILFKNDSLFMVETLLALGIAVDVSRIPLGANPNAQPTAEAWRALRQSDETLLDRYSFEHSLRCERFVGLDAICRFAVGEDGISDFPSDKSYRFFDWPFILRRFNDYYDHPEKLDDVLDRFEDTKKLNPIRGLYSRGRSELLALVMASTFLPARESFVEALARQDCAKNLRRISCAMQLYRAEHGTFPPAFSTDENGKPLHSWRVLILPYFEDEQLTALYQGIQLDEPWDSPANRPFWDKMPDVYRCPSYDAFSTMGANAPPSSINQKTTYSVIVGPNSIFGETGGTGRDPLALLQENPNREALGMILVTEREGEIGWMTPDAELTEAEALQGINPHVVKKPDTPGANGRVIASKHPGGVHCAAVNGSVVFVSDVKTAELPRLVTGNHASSDQ